MSSTSKARPSHVLPDVLPHGLPALRLELGQLMNKGEAGYVEEREV